MNIKKFISLFQNYTNTDLELQSVVLEFKKVKDFNEFMTENFIKSL